MHRRIAADLLDAVGRRDLPPHGKLPSEIALATHYGVSRGTVTKALDSLVQRGILYRRRPQGTFVASPVSGADAAIDGGGEGGRSRGPRPVIGLIIPYLLDSFSGGVVLGVEKVTRAAGYGLAFAYSENDWTLERYHIEQFLRSGVAGIVIFPAQPAVRVQDGTLVSVSDSDRVRLLGELQGSDVPFVLVDRYVPGVACDCVVSDDDAAGYAATQHLITLGHREIGFISTDPRITSTAERYMGYQRCLRERGLAVDDRLALHALRQTAPASMPAGIPVPNSGQADRAVLRDYLQRSDRPTAIVAVHDLVALRLLQVSEEIGLDVPADVALVSCGGNDIGANARVPVTSIVQPATELGGQAAHLVLDRIAGRSRSVRQVTLPVSLVVRKSCGAASRGGALDVSLRYA